MLSAVLKGIFGEKLTDAFLEQLLSKKLVGLTLTVLSILGICWYVASTLVDHPYYSMVFDLAQLAVVCVTVAGCIHQLAQYRLDKIEREAEKPASPVVADSPPATPEVTQ